MKKQGITVGGQTLSFHPADGVYRHMAKPFSKAEANVIAKPHTVIVNRADGSIEHVTLVGMTHTELRDAALVSAIATGDWDEYLSGRRITNEQWHSYIITLAEKYPDKVKTADCIKPPPRPDDDRETVA